MNERLKRYVTMRATKPIRNIGDCVHAIHTGTEFAAELRLTDLQEVLAENVRLESAFSDCCENAEAWRQKAERLQADVERMARAGDEANQVYLKVSTERERLRAALTMIADMEDEENEWDGRDRFRRVRDFARRVVQDGVVPISVEQSGTETK